MKEDEEKNLALHPLQDHPQTKAVCSEQVIFTCRRFLNEQFLELSDCGSYKYILDQNLGTEHSSWYFFPHLDAEGK